MRVARCELFVAGYGFRVTCRMIDQSQIPDPKSTTESLRRLLAAAKPTGEDGSSVIWPLTPDT